MKASDNEAGIIERIKRMLAAMKPGEKFPLVLGKPPGKGRRFTIRTHRPLDAEEKPPVE